MSNTYSLAVFTAYRENYGSPDLPYWKNKGGDDYIFTNIPAEMPKDEATAMIVKAVEFVNPMAEHTVVGVRRQTYQPFHDEGYIVRDFQNLLKV